MNSLLFVLLVCFSVTQGIWTQVRFLHAVPGFNITIRAPPLDGRFGSIFIILDFQLSYGQLSEPKNFTSDNGLYYWKIYKSNDPNYIISDVPVGMPQSLKYIWATCNQFYLTLFTVDYYAGKVLLKPIYENLETPPAGWIDGQVSERVVVIFRQ